MRYVFLLLILVWILNFPIGFAQAAAIPTPSPSPIAKPSATLWTAYILRQKNAEKIPEVKLPTRPLAVVMIQNEGRIRPMIEIRFFYDKPDWTLFFEADTPIIKNPKTNELILHFYLNSYVNEFNLKAVGPNKEEQSEKVFVYAPNIQEFQVYSAWDTIVFSIGDALFSYEQTNYGRFRSLSALFSAQYATPDTGAPLGFFSEGNLSMLTQWSSPTRQSPQILEGKMDLSYLFYGLLPDYRWRPQIMLGANYINMFNNNSPFGFANLISPDLGIRLKFYQDQQKTYIMDLRYMPLIVPVDLKHRGMSLALGLSYFLSNQHRVELSFNFSDYYYFPTFDQLIHAQIYSLKIGYGL